MFVLLLVLTSWQRWISFSKRGHFTNQEGNSCQHKFFIYFLDGQNFHFFFLKAYSVFIFHTWYTGVSRIEWKMGQVKLKLVMFNFSENRSIKNTILSKGCMGKSDSRVWFLTSSKTALHRGEDNLVQFAYHTLHSM